MKVNLNVAVKNIAGVDLTNEDGAPVLMTGLCVNALLGDYQGETLTGTQKMARYTLAKKLTDCKEEAEITVEEASLIKELIAKAFGPLVVGRVYEVLEGCS